MFPDIDASRLEMAKKIGADHTVLVTSRDPTVAAQAVEEAMGDKVDISIECSGAPPSLNTAIYVSHIFKLNLLYTIGWLN